MLMWGRSGAGVYESKGGKQINPSLVCLRFTVLCLEKASAHRGLRREEQTQVVWFPPGVASSKITQFKYLGRNSNAYYYPEVTVKPLQPVLGDNGPAAEKFTFTKILLRLLNKLPTHIKLFAWRYGKWLCDV